MKRKFFAVLMAAALCVGMLPSSVLADTQNDTVAPLSEVIDEEGDQDSVDSSTDDNALFDEVVADVEEVESYDYESETDLEEAGLESAETENDVESYELETYDVELEEDESPDEEVDDNEIMTMSVESGDVGISSFVVNEQVDGIGPFDDNNEPGNDSNASNDIVRSFDYVNYTLEYTTQLADAATPVDSSTILVELTLPCGPETASFNMSVMTWMNNPLTTYYMDDGTTKTEYDQDTDYGKITKQVLTGNMVISVPGDGTLSVGIYVGGAKNGTQLTPTFTAWMEGNVEADKVTIAQGSAGNQVHTLTVSAAQKYAIQIVQASAFDRVSDFDLSSEGGKDLTGNSDSITGRLEDYGVTVIVQNDTEEKGLKGLEFPQDETISFDLSLSEVVYGSGSNKIADSSEAGWTPVIWEYDENAEKRVTDNSATGNWGRTLLYYSWAVNAAPANKLGQTNYNTVYDSCYDGGDWTITQTGPTSYSVTIKNYTIDYKDYNFPTAMLGSGVAASAPGSAYKDNQACLSAGNLQCIVQYVDSEELTEDSSIQFEIKADNFSVGNTPFNVSEIYDNSYVVTPPGTMTDGVWFAYTKNSSQSDVSGPDLGVLGTSYTAGNGFTFRGNQIRLNHRINITSDKEVHTVIGFTKWDADALEVTGSTAPLLNRSSQSESDTINSYKVYYVGRDTNWSTDQEMSDTLMNDTSLTFYESPEAVTAAGQVCVGGLWLMDVDWDESTYVQIGFYLNVKDDASLIGNVYQGVGEGWASYSTLEDLESQYGSFMSGGKANTELIRNGYNFYQAYCSGSVFQTMGKSSGDRYYTKTAYDDNGNIIGGTNVTAYYAGASVLVCGECCDVEISTDKSIYNMDSGERTAKVTVQPFVSIDGSKSSSEGETKETTVTVSVTLDKDVTYDSGTAMWGDEEIEPEITYNDDGSEVLTFTLKKVTVGDDLDALTFDCTIGHAGYSDDVTNNESISLNATISSTDDNRTKSAAFGNSSTTSIHIVRLTSISIGKSVNHRGIELDGDFVWTLTFYNGSSTEKSATDMADVLPANGDENGSSFHGDYYITEVDIDFSGADKSYSDDHETMHFYVSNTYTGTGSDLAAGAVPTGWYDLITAPDENDDPNAELITIPVPEEYQDMKAFYCDLGELEAGETVVINLHVKTKGNEPGDTYNNIFYESASDQEIPVESNSVTTKVVHRNISGITWLDANQNGIQDSGEEPLANVKVTLYQVEDSEEPTGVTPLAETQAKDVYGNTVEPVVTGDDGSYTFKNLPGGTYRIEFSEVNGYLYTLTEQDVGDDDTIDSDAEFVSNYNGNHVAQISNVVLPPIEEMDRSVYNNDNNDAGYYNITVDIEGIKEWDDADDQDGLRPDHIIVYLLADGERISDGHNGYLSRQVTPDAEGNWTFQFTYLAKYNEDGTPIEYTIEEISVSGYETMRFEPVETEEGSGVFILTIENKHIPETIDISGEKVWDDANNQDGKRPGSVTINLLANGEPALDENGEAITATVTSDDDWKFSFTDLPKNKDGAEIQYNITEDAVDEYSTEIMITKDEDTGDYNVTVNNKYTPEQTSLSVIKVWEDNNNEAGFRPDSITVKLLANGEDTGKTLTLDESNDWQGSFTELDVSTPVAQPIEYTIEEISMDDYTTVTTGDGTTGFTITNKVIAPKLSKEVAEDDYERKEDSGEDMHEGEDTGGDGWGSWDDADNNQEVTYHLKVSEIQNVANLTVHDYLEEGIDFEADTVEISLFDGGSGKALTEGTDYTLTEGDCSDKDCPMDGCTFEVEFADELFTDVSSDAHLVITYNALTNTHEADYDDYEDDLMNYSYMVYGTNPLSLHRSAVVTAETDLFGFGIYKYAEVDGAEVALADAEFVLERSGMYATFEIETDEETGEDYYMVSGWVEDKDSADTLTSDAEGMIRIEGLDDDTYTITETKAPVGYDIVDETISVVIDEDGNVTVSGDTGSKEAVTGSVVNVENSLILTDIEGSKTWNDNDNQDGYRPESITIYLLADGEVVDSVTVTEEDGWSWSFTDKPMYKDGLEIAYTILEDAVENYSTEYDGFDVINNHTPDQTSVSVTKAWDDADDQDGIRPENVTVQLYADGKAVEDATLTLDESNNWTGSFTELDIYQDKGKQIVYTIEETEVPDGYECTVESVGESGYVFVATNSYTPEITEVSGSKTWDDSRDQDGKRPESITIRLLADGSEVDSATVTKSDKWAWSFTDLPKYSSGTEITYTVVEDAVEDYSTTYDGYDITNSYTPGQTSLTVVKTWDDSNNADGIRAASVTVELLKDGVNTGQTIVLTADNNWTGSFTELDEYTDGKLNIYAVQEVAVEGYTGTISGNETSGYVITNTHTPEKIGKTNPGGNGGSGNPDGSNPTSSGKGKTGDNNWFYLWITLIGAAAVLALVAVVRQKSSRVHK